MAHKQEPIELSVVIPCLNEARGIGLCVKECLSTFSEYGIRGEVIVVDNASSDNSAVVARKAGAIVVSEPTRGYGSAYMMGFATAKGEFIIIGDGDNTYNFHDIPKFLAQLKAGNDFV